METPLKLSEKHFIDTIPVRFVNGRIIADVQIHGRTYSFIVDTGSSRTVLFNPREMGAKPINEVSKLQDATGKEVIFRNYLLDSLRFGKNLIRNIEVYDISKRSIVYHMSDCSNIEGMIGADILAGKKGLKFDMLNKRLIYTDMPDIFENEVGSVSPISVAYNCPSFSISPLEGWSITNCLFDTGSRIMRLSYYNINDLIIRPELLEALEAQAVDSCRGSISGGVSGFQRDTLVTLYNLKNLMIGGSVLNNTPCATTFGSVLIGTVLLKYGAVTLDYRRHIMKFSPYSGKIDVKMAEEHDQCFFISKKDKILVGSVWLNSKAYKAGVRKGDEVIKIDGRDYDYCDYYNMVQFDDKEHTYTVRNIEGKIFDVVQ